MCLKLSLFFLSRVVPVMQHLILAQYLALSHPHTDTVPFGILKPHCKLWPATGTLRLGTQSPAAGSHRWPGTAMWPEGCDSCLLSSDGPIPLAFHLTALQNKNACPTAAMQEWRHLFRSPLGLRGATNNGDLLRS